MVEATTVNPTNRTKSKAAEVERELHKFEVPRFELPKFELPKFEVPAAFREWAEKGAAQARDTWERMKAATEEATDLLEGSYATASRGMVDYSLKMIEAARTNSNAAFDLAGELMEVKSVSEAVELSTAHMRRHFEALTAQTKELTALAQKIASEACEPIKEGMTNAFKKVA